VSDILIVGAGQLGSRYLQGMAQASSRHNVYVYDPSEESLLIASERYQEVRAESPDHEVVYTTVFADLPRDLDLVIVATSSSPRALVVQQVNQACQVRYWLLEKVLAPSIDELEIISRATQGSIGVWVNHWMRLPNWAKDLKQIIEKSDAPCVKMSVTGGNWGLACNATHFIDLFKWVSSKNILSMSTQLLESAWVESKRAGYFEIYGVLRVKTNDDSQVTLDCNHGDEPLSAEISWNSESFCAVFKNSGTITTRYNSEPECTYPFPYQSDMTGGIVDSILSDGGCELPTYDEAQEYHAVFMTSLLQHWNEVHADTDIGCDRLMIT
jgi:hypothetical protein